MFLSADSAKNGGRLARRAVAAASCMSLLGADIVTTTTRNYNKRKALRFLGVGSLASTKISVVAALSFPTPGVPASGHSGLAPPHPFACVCVYVEGFWVSARVGASAAQRTLFFFLSTHPD